MHCCIGNDDLQEDWVSMSYRNELAEGIVIGSIVEDEIFADVTRNYKINSYMN